MDDVPDSSLTVQTRLGEIRGIRKGGVLHFRGIRYAAPPVEERRFLPPLPSSPWTGTYDATAFPNRAMQPDMAVLGEPVGATSEDCLFLNIVTPAAEGAGRPVLFWIHGGGFVNGSANEYDGSVLAARGDVVVVTVNYRLGLFGFLDLSAFGDAFAGSASNGLRDQVLALEWVRDNIADYGGDPDNVTIFGESAGGHSVHALLAAPSADGLYHKAIAHSPGTANQPPPDVATPLVDALGCRPDQLVEKLRAMSADELLGVQGTVPGVGGGVDGTVVTRSTDDAISARGERGVPLIAGTNRDEGKFFTALYAAFDPGFAPPNEGLARSITEGGDPSAYLAALKAAHPGADAIEIHERVWGDMFRKARWAALSGPPQPVRAAGSTASTCRRPCPSWASKSVPPMPRRYRSPSTASTATIRARWSSTMPETRWCAACRNGGRTRWSPSRERATPTAPGCPAGRATTRRVGRR